MTAEQLAAMTAWMLAVLRRLHPELFQEPPK